MKSYPSLIEFAVLAYCLWQAADLPISWVAAPYARYAWIAFIIWCLPAFYYMTRCILNDSTKESNLYLLGAAILASLLGSLGSLHILRHIGLALAIGGTLPFHALGLVWLAMAISWLPGFGWMVKSLPLQIVPALQIILASIGTGAMIYRLRRS